MGGGKIPDRWLKYNAVGRQIYGTNLIAFKVPLNSDLNRDLQRNERFSCTQLLERVPNLGLIIDLTNTYRYYDPNVFKERGIEYAKVMTRGHDVPDSKIRILFSKLVKEFSQSKLNSKKLIGVHCTHGVNRTGFLICHFMITELKISPVEAIKRFENSRGYGIERSNYLEFLNNLTLSQLKQIADNFHKYETSYNYPVPNDMNRVRTNFRKSSTEGAIRSEYQSRYSRSYKYFKEDDCYNPTKFRRGSTSRNPYERNNEEFKHVNSHHDQHLDSRNLFYPYDRNSAYNEIHVEGNPEAQFQARFVYKNCERGQSSILDSTRHATQNYTESRSYINTNYRNYDDNNSHKQSFSVPPNSNYPPLSAAGSHGDFFKSQKDNRPQYNNFKKKIIFE